jgi:hypothetical protein
MKTLLISVLFAALAMAQTGTGTVVVSTTITATAQQSPGDANAIVCTATPVNSQISVTCKVGATTGLSATYTVLPGSTSATNAAVASFVYGGNSVVWMLYQPASSGPISWQVAANGAAKSGQF